VVAIDSDDDEDIEEGVVFKRRRVVAATTSHSATNNCPTSFRDHPPSTSSPRGLLALECGGESTPKNDQVPPTPELPAVLHHALKSFEEQEAVEALDGNMLRERMSHGLGEFLVHSSALVSEA